MRYPYIAYSQDIQIKPMFRELSGDPVVIDLSSTSTIYEGIDVRDQRKFQSIIENMMGDSHTWGVASYLENRKKALSTCPQMLEEERWYHLGLDVIVPLDTPLHAPLNARVEQSGYEAGDANYGGYVLLQHESTYFETFYSFYGHLNKDKLPRTGLAIKAGEPFAFIGDFHENGNWFYHTHFQVITQKGLDQGYISKGYCAAADLANIDSLCPSPLSLFTT